MMLYRVSARGFTLLEVMVALAIFALAFGAFSSAMGQMLDGAEILKRKQCALWVAQNRLALHQAQQDWLELGEQKGDVVQAGIAYHWRELVSVTPNADFRRVEVRVYDEQDEDFAQAVLIGYVVHTR